MNTSAEEFSEWFDVLLIPKYEARLVPNPNYHEMLPDVDKTMEVLVQVGTQFCVELCDEYTIAADANGQKALEQMADFLRAATKAFWKLNRLVSENNGNKIQGDSSG